MYVRNIVAILTFTGAATIYIGRTNFDQRVIDFRWAFINKSTENNQSRTETTLLLSLVYSSYYAGALLGTIVIYTIGHYRHLLWVAAGACIAIYSALNALVAFAFDDSIWLLIALQAGQVGFSRW